MREGIYSDKDLSIDKYHEDRTILSSTGLKMAKTSSRHFAYYLVYGSEHKAHFDFGNAFELALMESVGVSTGFSDEVAVLETEKWTASAIKEKPELISPKASNHYKDLKSQFEQDNFGKYQIPDVGNESKETLDMMVKSCMADPTIKALLQHMEYQNSFVWRDEQTGILCKTRPDCAKRSKRVVVDIKTCQDASPQKFARDCANFDYPIQAMMQIDGAVKAGYFDEIDEYFWLAVEKNPPYNAVLYRFQKDDMIWASDMYDFYKKRAANVIAEFLNGKLPEEIRGYSENADNRFGIIDLEIPLYYQR